MRYLYIGKDDCKKASCNRKQEFPNGPSEYCLDHGLESFLDEQAANTGGPDS